MLFVDFSSAFNAIIPHKLVTKLSNLGLGSSLCTWVLDFLRNRPQRFRIGPYTLSTLSLSTGTPQGCVLSPFLYSLFTHNCTPIHPTNIETAYRDEIQRLSQWCYNNNLDLNTSKILSDIKADCAL